MSEQSKIQWCDDTVNPVHGCDKVSPGCANCYITTTTPFRVSGMKHGDPRTFHPSAFKLALKLNRKPWVCDCGLQFTEETARKCSYVCASDGHDGYPVPMRRRRIFWESLGDWLDDKWEIKWLAKMLDTIRRCPDCDHILVSKRWENWGKRMNQFSEYVASADDETNLKFADTLNWGWEWYGQNAAPKNIIGLCSVENQEMADKRIPPFLQVPLWRRGLSLEPLLGPVDLNREIGAFEPGNDSPMRSSWLSKLHWLIPGGESGKNARPCNVDWIRSLVAQGKAAGVPVFVKQLGSNPFHFADNDADGTRYRFFCNDKKGGDISEFPEDLRVREFYKPSV